MNIFSNSSVSKTCCCFHNPLASTSAGYLLSLLHSTLHLVILPLCPPQYSIISNSNWTYKFSLENHNLNFTFQTWPKQILKELRKRVHFVGHVRHKGIRTSIRRQINAGSGVLIVARMATIWVYATSWNLVIFVAKPAIIPIDVGVIVQ